MKGKIYIFLFFSLFYWGCSKTILKADHVKLSDKMLPPSQSLIFERCFFSMSDSIDNLNQYIPNQVAKKGIVELEIKRSKMLIFLFPSIFNISAFYRICYSIYGLEKNADD
jgi:hypothetical protein